MSESGAAPHDLAFFLELENQVWAALVAGDRSADDRLLDDEFLGVYPSGFASRADHVGQLNAGATVAHYRLSEARLLPLGEDLVLLSYRAKWQRVAAQTDLEEAMYESTLWRRTVDGRWLNLFSQDSLSADLKCQFPTAGPHSSSEKA